MAKVHLSLKHFRLPVSKIECYCMYSEAILKMTPGHRNLKKIKDHWYKNHGYVVKFNKSRYLSRIEFKSEQQKEEFRLLTQLAS